MVEKEENIKERVDSDVVTLNFTVSNCPETIYNRFVDYCKKNAGNYYAMGLKQLLDTAEADAKSLMLYEKIIALEVRITELEGKKDEKARLKPKTMGSGGKKNE